MNKTNNPFILSDMPNGTPKENAPTRFLVTMYNLNLGFQGVDEFDAIELIMELEDILDGITNGTRCLE